MALRIVLVAIAGYFLGNLNGAFIMYRLLTHEDIRKSGSGNAGLTNFMRQFGPSKGMWVLLIDIGKAVIACLLGKLLLAPLGLSMEGVRNVLAVTGDPVPSAERDEVKSVYQFNSRMLARFIRSLNENELNKPFRIYGALNVNARKFEHQLRFAKEKVYNGVSAFLTQPVLTEEALENLKKAREVINGKILGGIIPVVSSRNARFMNSEISGITVDEKIVEIYEGKSRDECTKLAIDISTEIARRMAPYVDGYYIVTPFSRTDIITEIVKNIRE